MRIRSVIAVTVLLVSSPPAGRSPAGGPGSEPRQEATDMKKLTPVLPVQAIEPVLAFWEALGFERTAEVPDGDTLGFVILGNGPVEIMYQTYASIGADLPALASTPQGGTLLFIEVEDLDAVEAALGDAERVHPRRKTFYGADELSVREPGGNVVTFGEFEPRDG